MFTDNKQLSELLKCTLEEFLKNKNVATYELFELHLYEEIKTCPEEWRIGQKIYNTLYKYLPYEVKHMSIPFDCFYKDENIEDFLEGVYVMWKNK